MSSLVASGTATSRVEIPPHLHASLQRLASSAYRRGNRSAWSAEGVPDVPADAVSQLALRNLVKVTHVRRLYSNQYEDHVELTDIGREIAEMIRDRRRLGARRPVKSSRSRPCPTLRAAVRALEKAGAEGFSITAILGAVQERALSEAAREKPIEDLHLELVVAEAERAERAAKGLV